MMTSPRASIIVRCYNERAHIGKLLHGIFEQTMQDFEVILVDSGSTDGTLEVAKQYPIDDIQYIAPEDFSFGRALNIGCEAASGEFCVMASAHVYPKFDDWLEKLLEKFEDDDVALVYGKQRGNDVTKYAEKQVLKQWFPDHDIDYQDNPFCNNANAAIRRELWKEFPYDEKLAGLEDVDWAKRIQEAGYEISYASQAEIIHVHDETTKEIYNRYRREAYAHKHIVPEQQRFTFFTFLQTFFRNTVSDYMTAISERKFIENVVDIPYFRFLQFWGTYRGFNQEGPISEQLWQRFYYPDRTEYPPEQEEVKSKPQQTSTNRSLRDGEEKIDYSSIEPDTGTALE